MTPNVSLPMYDLPEMWADNARFGEALRGLLRAHDWGLITVEFSEREDGIWLSVEDIGIGMSEAVLTGSLLDFGAPAGWSRDFPASRRKEWFPLDQVWYRLFLCVHASKAPDAIARVIPPRLTGAPLVSNTSRNRCLPGTELEFRIRLSPAESRRTFGP